MKAKIGKLKKKVPPTPVEDTKAQLKDPLQGNPIAISYCIRAGFRRQVCQLNVTGKLWAWLELE
ncbi:MAG TPA: hypothetical protein VIH69_08100 [Dehalococcoidia bacterium]